MRHYYRHCYNKAVADISDNGRFELWHEAPPSSGKCVVCNTFGHVATCWLCKDLYCVNHLGHYSGSGICNEPGFEEGTMLYVDEIPEGGHLQDTLPESYPPTWYDVSSTLCKHCQRRLRTIVTIECLGHDKTFLNKHLLPGQYPRDSFYTRREGEVQRMAIHDFERELQKHPLSLYEGFDREMWEASRASSHWRPISIDYSQPAPYCWFKRYDCV